MCMTTLLDKTLKREVRIRDRPYIVAISPLGCGYAAWLPAMTRFKAPSKGLSEAQ